MQVQESKTGNRKPDTAAAPAQQHVKRNGVDKARRKAVFVELAVRDRGGPAMYPSPGWGMDAKESVSRAKRQLAKEAEGVRSAKPELSAREARREALENVRKSMEWPAGHYLLP